MTVAELIEKLERMPRDAEAVSFGESYDYAIINEVKFESGPDLALEAPNAKAKIRELRNFVTIG